MNTVWKYRLLVRDRSTWSQWMPAGATILHVDSADASEVVLWALVDTAAERDPRTFLIVGTGQACDPDARYVGTAVIEPFVWHVFEVSV